MPKDDANLVLPRATSDAATRADEAGPNNTGGHAGVGHFVEVHGADADGADACVVADELVLDGGNVEEVGQHQPAKLRMRNASSRAALLDERARGLRASLTPSEALLWARLRGRRLGVVFRRQVPLLCRFIADFLAPAERLVIEVDGGHHAEQARADAHRDAVLGRAGYRVLRLDAALVIGDIEATVACVRAALEQ